MAHGITNEDKMAYAGKAPWHSSETRDRLVQLPDAVSSEEMVKAAGLDWDVELKPVYTNSDGEFIEIPNFFSVVRTDTRRVLGLVRGRYQPIPNRVPFSMLDELVASGDLKYETAGSLWGGRYVWALARIPEEITVAGDRHFKYLLATTTHDGTQALRILPTVVRVVCNNTLNMALLSPQARKLTYRVFHVPGSVKAHVPKAREALQISLTAFRQFESVSEKLLAADGLPIVDKLLEKLFPADDDQPSTRVQRQRERFMYIVDQEKAYLGSKLTGYHLLNAVTGYADHVRRVNGKDEDAKLSRRMFNTMINTNPGMWKPRAIDLVLDMTGVRVPVAA